MQLSVWVLPFPTLGERQLFHYRASNPAKNTKVEHKVPPRCLGYLCFLCMLIIHATSDLHPPNPTHQMVTPTTHHLPPNTSPHNVPPQVCGLGQCHQVHPQKSLRHQFPSQLMQLFPNTTIVPKQILTIALWFLLAKQMRVTCIDNVQMFSF